MQYGRYTFSLLFQDDAILPEYKGSTFRGALGHALKKVVCALKLQDCNDCLLHQRCVYSLVFEQPPSADGDGRKRIAASPHPYVIELPYDSKTQYSAGEPFSFDLLLFGKANDYLPYFIYAFDQMGKTGIGRKTAGGRAAFLLNEVIARDEIVYSSSTGKLRQGQFACDLTLSGRFADFENAVSKARLTLLTPLRLKYANHLEASLPFHVLIRAVLRRISSLLQYHGNGEPALDYRGLVARAEAVVTEESSIKWFDWKRFSNRQDQSMFFGGMIGSAVYSGNLSEFVPLIRFCEETHLGKQTSFGLGKIEFKRICLCNPLDCLPLPGGIKTAQTSPAGGAPHPSEALADVSAVQRGIFK